jgi:hypothetical protein
MMSIPSRAHRFAGDEVRRCQIFKYDPLERRDQGSMLDIHEQIIISHKDLSVCYWMKHWENKYIHVTENVGQ